MNEVIKEQPDLTAAKMAQFVKDIEELKDELNIKNNKIYLFETMQKEFATVGPMKEHIEILQKIVSLKDTQLANEIIDKEEYRQNLNSIQQENREIVHEYEVLIGINEQLEQIREATTTRSEAQEIEISCLKTEVAAQIQLNQILKKQVEGSRNGQSKNTENEMLIQN